MTRWLHQQKRVSLFTISVALYIAG